MVIPTQSGGTEFIRKSLMPLGWALGGELDGRDGTVGWCTACEGDAKAWKFAKTWMKKGGGLGKLSTRFKWIVHQTREPVAQIRSNLAWCDISDLNEYNMWEFVWDYIEHLSPGIPYRDPDSGEWESCLYRSMLYYLSWHRYLESVADFRIQVETENAAVELCKVLLENLPADDIPPTVRALGCQPKRVGKVDRHSHGGQKKVLTWDDLYRENEDVAAEIAVLAQRYGYDVPERQQ